VTEIQVDHSLHLEASVCFPCTARWSAQKRGRGETESAPVRLHKRGIGGRKSCEDRGVPDYRCRPAGRTALPRTRLRWLSARAREAISRATTLAAKSEDRDAELCVGIEWARVSAAIGDVPAAERRLQSAITEAKRYQYFGYELEASLVLGEVQMKGQDSAKGRARLSALARMATSKGFDLITNAVAKELP
jgi:hypothetical protein